MLLSVFTHLATGVHLRSGAPGAHGARRFPGRDVVLAEDPAAQRLVEYPVLSLSAAKRPAFTRAAHRQRMLCESVSSRPAAAATRGKKRLGTAVTLLGLNGCRTLCPRQPRGNGSFSATDATNSPVGNSVITSRRSQRVTIMVQRQKTVHSPASGFVDGAERSQQRKIFNR